RCGWSGASDRTAHPVWDLRRARPGRPPRSRTEPPRPRSRDPLRAGPGESTTPPAYRAGTASPLPGQRCHPIEIEERTDLTVGEVTRIVGALRERSDLHARRIHRRKARRPRARRGGRRLALEPVPQLRRDVAEVAEVVR